MQLENYVDLYEPQKMMEALKQIHAPKTFLFDTFFRRKVLHTTKEVQFDIVKKKRRTAAYVNPLHDGVVVERTGYSTESTKPAYVKEMIPLRAADTQIRLPAETPYTPSTPRERMATILGEDLLELKTRFIRLKEKMCAEALWNGKVIVKGKGWDAQVDFRYEDGVNKIVLSGTSAWNDVDHSDPMRDLDRWRKMIVKRSGIQPTHCIISSDAAWAIIDNAKAKSRLDNRSIEMGKIDPKSLAEGISYYGRLVLPSGIVELFSYDESYTDPETGEEIDLVPPGKVLLGSENASCAFHYGLIQNLQFLDAADEFASSWMKPDGSARFTQLEMAPMPNLYQTDAFLVADVMEV